MASLTAKALCDSHPLPQLLFLALALLLSFPLPHTEFSMQWLEHLEAQMNTQ